MRDWRNLKRMLNRFDFAIRNDECADCAHHWGCHDKRCPSHDEGAPGLYRVVGASGFHWAVARLPCLDTVERIMGPEWIQDEIFEARVHFKEPCIVCGDDCVHRLGCPNACRFCAFVGHKTVGCPLKSIMVVEKRVAEEEDEEDMENPAIWL